MHEYIIGVMMTPVENPGQDFNHLIDKASKIIEHRLTECISNLQLEIFEFIGPHLTPSRGGYSPLELLQLGMIEKIERKPNFLLVITEVELSAHLTTYSIALPSRLTNVGVISTKRLDPNFWGQSGGDDVTAERLAGLMLQTVGYLLNLQPNQQPDNIMYPFEKLDDLKQMRGITDQQVKQIKKALPAEAHDKTAKPPAQLFVLKQIIANSTSILSSVIRVNPLRLAAQMTTMIAAAISLMIVIFFSTEIWDIGSTVELYQFALFALVSILIATLVVYRAYPLRKVVTHTRHVSEMLVVTNTATLITLFLTMLVLYIAFWMLVYFGILTFFPRTLMEAWPTVDPAIRTLDHIKISTFIAAMGTLVGSLGGRVENQNIMRRILFLEVNY